MMWLERRLRRKASKLLERGDVAKGISLLEKAQAWDALVGAHRDRGDLRAAALAAEKAGDYERGAGLFEEAGAFGEAAQLWLRASQKDRAAIALEKAGDFEAAARLLIEVNMPSRAAGALAMLQRFGEAGQLYEQAGEQENAVKMYRAANQLDQAARLLEATGDFDGAARLCRESGDHAGAARLFAKADEPLEAVRSYTELGMHKEAGRLFEGAGYLLQAAEAYSRDATTLGESADLLAKVLRPDVVWQQETAASPTCLSVADDGEIVAVGCANHRLQILKSSGELVWSFRPPRGGVPRCVALSARGRVAVGCDDRRLHLLESDKTLLWSFTLPEEPVKLAVDCAGERILCLTKDNNLLCLSHEGALCWDQHVKGQVWDVALSGDGSTAAMGTAAGSCVLMTRNGEHVGDYKATEWVHSVSLSADGALCALGTGMQGVELIDARRLKSLWSAQDGSWVHNVVLTPSNAVLSTGDDEALLRDEHGIVIWRHKAQERLMRGDMDPAQRFAVFRCVKRKLARVDLLHCKDRAAALYERVGNADGAAAVYEAMGDHAKAAELFKSTGNHVGAARNLETLGQALEAAELYERAEDWESAAHLFQAQREFERAANCFMRIGAFEKAAELFELAGNAAKAAEVFAQAARYGKAGDLYKAIGDVQAAIKALQRHVASHPDDLERHLALGLLMKGNGQYDTAIEQFQKTVMSERFHKAALKHMADCFAAKNLYDIAINRYKSCLQEDEEASTENLDVYYGMGRAHELAGHYSEAKRIYETVMAVDYQYEDVKQRLEEVETLSGIFSPAAKAAAPAGQATMGATYQVLSAEAKERYAVKKLLGKGGMGEVYLAEDKRLKRTVALKILPPELAADEQLRLRMIREAQAVAQISHPNVVAVFDVGEEAGRSYISMEYVDGPTLRNLFKERATFDPKECASLLRQLAEGLGCAHAKGVTHRDMKPENVIVASDGTAKIMDFGLAVIQGATRLTIPGGVSGTWRYMAPEQVRGEAVLTAAVDVYAVGCMGYELLTGKPPFQGDNVGVQHLSSAPKTLTEVRADVPALLNDVIMKCLEKRPEDRYPDASSLSSALAEVADALS